MEHRENIERKRLKFSSLIKRMIDEILRKEVSDPRIGFITLTDVKITPDMKKATIFIDTQGSAQEQQNSIIGLKEAQGYVKHILSKKLHIRFVPEIEFAKYEGKGWRIEQILKEIEKEEKKHERENT